LKTPTSQALSHPNGHLASPINPFRFPLGLLSTRRRRRTRRTRRGGGDEILAGRESDRKKERKKGGGGGEIWKWSDDEYE
jgi:hypothetical protein